jgi:hypothetical protein
LEELESEQDPPPNPFKLREFMLLEDFLKNTSRVDSENSREIKEQESQAMQD